MQIVFIGDNLHEILNPFSEKNMKKYFKMSSAENFTQTVNLSLAEHEHALPKQTV